MSALKYWVWLSSCDKLSPRTKAELIKQFSSPEKVYNLTEEELKSSIRLKPSEIQDLLSKSFEKAEKIISDCHNLGIQILTMQDSSYPNRLLQIPDPPLVLYIKGALPLIDELPVITVVGTRKCTAYALANAERIGYEISKCGGIVVSGVANGIDQAALSGALKAGAKTIGVMGCGLDINYPKTAFAMRKDISSNGALISEYPPGAPALAQNFPIRNRIMSGLSVATLVVKAPKKSGALITANLALEQDRDVFVFKSDCDDINNSGGYELIREGACAIKSGYEIMDEYTGAFSEYITCQSQEHIQPSISETEKLILSVINDEPVHIDTIIEKTGLNAGEVLANLTVMEISGCVCQLPGKRFKRQPGW